MVELGKYAETVLGGYAVTITLIVVLVAVSIHRSRQKREALAKLEAKHGRKHG
ncbi:MAG: heme exporter protein CcmD [Paracoccaceae bacterium]